MAEEHIYLRETVFHRDIQTPRRELKIRRAVEYLWRKILGVRIAEETVSRVFDISSHIEAQTKEKRESEIVKIHANWGRSRPLLLLICQVMYFKGAHRVETQQNIELMNFAVTWSANIFVGCSVTPTFFRQITSFSDFFHYTKEQNKKIVRRKF